MQTRLVPVAPTAADLDVERKFLLRQARLWQRDIRAGSTEAIATLRRVLVTAEPGVQVRAAEILMRAAGMLRNKVDVDSAEQVRDALRGLMLRDARQEEKTCVTVDAMVTAPGPSATSAGVGGDTRSRTSNDDPLMPSPNLCGPGPNAAVGEGTASVDAGEGKAEGVGRGTTRAGGGGGAGSQCVGVEELGVKVVEVDGCGEVVEGSVEEARRGKYFGAVDALEEKGAVEEREYNEVENAVMGMGMEGKRRLLKRMLAAYGPKRGRRRKAREERKEGGDGI